MEMIMATEWFTRYGTVFTGRMHDVNEAKGTAAHTYQDRCSRCGGAGGSSKWAMTGFTCFDCNGSGKGSIRTEKLYTAEKLAKLNVSQAKRDAVAAAKLQAKVEQLSREADARRAEFEAANPGLIAAIEQLAAGENPNPFMLDMARRLRDLGTLTGNQTEAVKTSVARIAAQAAAKAASGFVGEVGKRVNLVLTIERIIQLEAANSYMPRYARFAAPSLHLCRDEQGNRVVYKGTGFIGQTGETVRLKATVEEHSDYKGEKQTKIARPKVEAAG
jgi:hypothetical protein